jgi:hypothetical protein
MADEGKIILQIEGRFVRVAAFLVVLPFIKG